MTKKDVELAVGSVIVPKRKTSEGVLIRATSLAWAAIVEELKNDWTIAYKIPPRVWEELIAGAYANAGFDEVTLTPRTGDHGRDVIAVRKGVSSIRILGSVNAYKPGHLITRHKIAALWPLPTKPEVRPQISERAERPRKKTRSRCVRTQMQCANVTPSLPA